MNNFTKCTLTLMPLISLMFIGVSIINLVITGYELNKVVIICLSLIIYMLSAIVSRNIRLGNIK